MPLRSGSGNLCGLACIYRKAKFAGRPSLRPPRNLCVLCGERLLTAEGAKKTRSERREKRKGGLLRPSPVSRLLRCQFFGLAFVPHQLERTLGLLVRGGDLLLHLGRGLFHLGR